MCGGRGGEGKHIHFVSFNVFLKHLQNSCLLQKPGWCLANYTPEQLVETMPQSPHLQFVESANTQSVLSAWYVFCLFPVRIENKTFAPPEKKHFQTGKILNSVRFIFRKCNRSPVHCMQVQRQDGVEKQHQFLTGTVFYFKIPFPLDNILI